MGSYDSAGFQDRVPGRVVVESTGYGGSVPGGIPDTSAEPGMGTVGFSAFVVPSGASTLNGDRVQVGLADVNVGRQQDLYSGADADPLSGISGDFVGHTGIGGGSYGHSHGGAA